MGAMEARRLLFTLASLASAQLGLTSAASAATGLALMPSTVMLAAVGLPSPCDARLQPTLGAVPVSIAGAQGISKARAILGGGLSKLEMIAQAQAAPIASPALAQGATLAGAAMTPGAGGASCQDFAMPQSGSFGFRPGLRTVPVPGEDFLASRRLPVSKTAFDAQWSRVSRGSLPRGLTAALASSLPAGNGAANLAAVNAWANARIRYVDDQVLYGKTDYWADAGATLKRGAGDCEDIAIAKLQLLAAMGVPRGDMYLTIARDLTRRADHALLVVKLDGKHWLLDNSTNLLLDARESYDYRPILSYSAAGTWLHGY
jgi:predicted transglutaminase-like cysteine proteinase